MSDIQLYLLEYDNNRREASELSKQTAASMDLDNDLIAVATADWSS